MAGISKGMLAGLVATIVLPLPMVSKAMMDSPDMPVIGRRYDRSSVSPESPMHGSTLDSERNPGSTLPRFESIFKSATRRVALPAIADRLHQLCLR